MPLSPGICTFAITRSNVDGAGAVSRADVAPLGGGDRPARAQQQLQRCARLRIVLDDEDARLELLCARHARQR